MRLASLTWCLLLVWCGFGCSRSFSSQDLGVQYEPPSGMGLRSVDAGPPALARFDGGLELRSVRGAAPALDAGPEAVLAAAGLKAPGKLLQDTEGTLPAGPVARYEFSQTGGSRTLVYFVPRKDGFVLVTFSAPERDYGALSARVERSLSTLRTW
ncbi:hypothetical protein [Myxococcus xanthus]|uniref:hypothetical protein n=1 Tax=Myxococcus xanthus TaxID=34 RepID=UPI00112666F0|nr:hypothetical protein [Myxococcus xanthus]QDE95735.1 hypothetical protein BHS05_07510 [Myxococcus xanthus]